MKTLEKENEIPEEFKDLAKDFADKGFITTSSKILSTGQERAHSLDDLWLSLLCCRDDANINA